VGYPVITTTSYGLVVALDLAQKIEPAHLGACEWSVIAASRARARSLREPRSRCRRTATW